MKQRPINIRRLTQLALLFALSIVLMAIEMAIPPIPTMPPGVKLGLSNIIVMFCLFYRGKADAFVILVLKSIFVLLTRGFIAFLLSFSGGIFSIIVMILLLQLKKSKLSYIIISMCASLAHNMAQLMVSMLLLQTTSVFYYSPILIMSGVLMGIITGTVLKLILPAMQKVNDTLLHDKKNGI